MPGEAKGCHGIDRPGTWEWCPGIFLIKAFDRSVSVYKAMLARGYDEDAKTPPYYTGPIPAKDILAGVLAGLILVAMLVCNFASAWKGRS